MQVIITPKAQKHFKSLPQSEQVKVRKKLRILETEAFSGKKLAGELSESWVIKAWPYRIFYYFNKETKTIYVTAILHRQGAYK